MYEYRSSRIVTAKSIEELTLMLKFLMNHEKQDQIKNYLVGDAYLMQSIEGTAIKKGAAIKGMVSTISFQIEKLRKSLIFTSEDVDHTLRRILEKR